MRNQRGWWSVVMAVGMALGVSGAVPAHAEEISGTAAADPATSSQSSQTESAAATPEATPEAAPAPVASAAAPVAAPAAPAAPVVKAPTVAPATPDLKPIVIKFSGEVVQVNRQDAEHPALTVRDRYGVTKEMTSEAKAVESMKTGDQVTVEYTYDVATGKRQVQTATVTQAAQASAAAQ